MRSIAKAPAGNPRLLVIGFTGTAAAMHDDDAPRRERHLADAR